MKLNGNLQESLFFFLVSIWRCYFLVDISFNYTSFLTKPTKNHLHYIFETKNILCESWSKNAHLDYPWPWRVLFGPEHLQSRTIFTERAKQHVAAGLDRIRNSEGPGHCYIVV